MNPQEILAEFEQSGRHWFRQGPPERELAVLDSVLNLDEKAGERIGPQAALLNVLSKDSALGRIMSMFEQSLVPVRVVAFNKTQNNNWGVPWHQDRVICVSERHEPPAFVNWSKKSDIWHCEPTTEILERMFFVRVHLDSSDPDDGTMRIAVGSHKGVCLRCEGLCVSRALSDREMPCRPWGYPLSKNANAPLLVAIANDEFKTGFSGRLRFGGSIARAAFLAWDIADDGMNLAIAAR